jgi:hypothetical protein
MSISAFTTAFIGGTRKNRFRVKCNIPGFSPAATTPDEPNPAAVTTAGDGGSNPTGGFDDFHVLAAAMPASIITTNPIDYRGRRILYPGDRVYSAEGFNVWTITVLDDKNNSAITDTYKNLWHAAHAWSDSINDHETNRGSVSYCNILVEQLSLNGEDTTGGSTGQPIKRATLINAWPQSISPLEMEMQARDQYNSFDITFAFQYVTYDTTLAG